jgi:hypothetical protein
MNEEFPSPLWGGAGEGASPAMLQARKPLTQPLRGYRLPTRGRG